MIRERKVVQLMKKNDYLSQLPNEILNTITGMLDIKDAVKTSILSKKWRYIWINHTDLRFNQVNILGLEFSLFIDAHTIFVKIVDQIMQQRLKGNDKINSFCLRFELEKCFSRSIDSWISCAVKKSVETIDLDFSRFSSNSHEISSSRQRYKRYNFSLLRTVSENKGSLKHLRIAFCNFQGRSSSKKFGSLVSFELQSVNISSLQLTKVLESCPLIEKLALDECSKLTYLRIGHSNNTFLKIFSLKNCIKLMEIDFGGNNLISLELTSINISNLQMTKILKSCPVLEELRLNMCPNLSYMRLTNSLKILSLNYCNRMEIDLYSNNLHTLEYTGMPHWFSIKFKIRRLVNIFIDHGLFYSIKYPITKLCRDVPMLENLILSPEVSLECFMFEDDHVDVFPNMRRLFLPVSHFMCDHMWLWVIYILKSFPLLQTLELNLCEFLPVSQQRRKKEVTEKCPNGAITKLELNGFIGEQHHVDLIKYLLENLTGLEVLAIGPSYKIYKGFNCWDNQYATIERIKKFQNQIQWLRAIISPSVRLEFLI